MRAFQIILSGLIVATFGRHYEIETAQGRLQCYPRGKKSTFVCGDEVNILLNNQDQGVITYLYPRNNLLWRSDAFRQKLIASNLDCIAIIVAAEPGFSDLFISRCLSAAENQNITPLIVLNKVDLTQRLAAARAQLAPFAALGYTIIETSALNGADKTLYDFFAARQSLFIGQSGMGKSTLTNALVPEAQAHTREISTALDTGKHTTTVTRLYPIGNNDGWLIDSPGLQAFGLAHLSLEELAESFIEFRPYLGQCRFRDCRHEKEPGCALLEAVQAQSISSDRFEHYCTIRTEIETARQLNPGW